MQSHSNPFVLSSIIVKMTIAILLELSDKKYVEVKPQIYDYKGERKTYFEVC